MKKFNLIIGLSSGVILFLVIIFTDGLEDLVNQIAGLNPVWISIAALCMFVKWVVESSIMHSITKTLFVKQRFIDSLKVTMIGQFFNSVTPFASGGQPAQLYVLMRDGIPAGIAGSILMVKFIVYQSILTTYSLIIILFKAAFFKKQVSGFLYFALIGFGVNIIVILSALLFAKYQNLTRKILTKIFGFLKKIRLIKNSEETEKRFEEQLISFHQNASMLKSNIGLLLQTSILTVIQLTMLYIIPFFIHKSFGLSGVKLTDMIAANAFVAMTTAFVPLPGAAGGAEGGFYFFFSFFFTPQNIMAAIFIWRIITYYFNIGFGGLFAVLAPEKPLKTLQKSLD